MHGRPGATHIRVMETIENLAIITWNLRYWLVGLIAFFVIAGKCEDGQRRIDDAQN